jgi:hypothetical protein
VLTDDLNDIDAIPDPVNDFLRNQASAHESRSSYIPVVHDRTSRLRSDRIN